MTTLVQPSAALWHRRRDGAVLIGACRAVSRALGLPLPMVRLAFLSGPVMGVLALLPLVSGSLPLEMSLTLLPLALPFVLGYLALWWALPLDASEQRRSILEAATAAVRGRPGAARPAVLQPRQFSRWFALAALIGLGVVLLGLAALLPITVIAGESAFPLGGTDPSYQALTLVAMGVVGAGLALGVLPLDALQRARWGGRIGGLPRLVLATLTVAVSTLVLGALAAVGSVFGSAAAMIAAAVSAILLLLLAAIIVPWGRHLWRGMREESEERALVQQRSEFTAHLHDSVLQTLTLLQKPGVEAEEMRRLARLQERELRRWLYHDPGVDAEDADDLREAVTALAEDAEDRYGAEVDVVVVGEAPTGEYTRALLGALREAVANACRHGGGDVSVFVDVSPEEIEVFVRDRGPGFELDGVPSDRLGVRESILGRMERAGGHALVRRAPGGGTEVALTMETTSAGRRSRR
ncbi:MAG: hypothetical protein Q4G40_01665 [Brachybacterium sp.]|nr:hypothetical protein [Brachybacterium sp.]